MADIIPFRGLRYSELSGLSRLVAPPYDIISPQYRRELYARDPHNVVRVDFGMPEDGDSEGNNQYTRAAKNLGRWLGDGVLKREGKPALYLYEIEYETPSGEKKTMRGFICLLKLEEWDKGIVLPHEGTLKGPKADRFELLKAASASASQVFALYSDPEKKISRLLASAVRSEAGLPALPVEAIDDDGSRHRLRVVTDTETIDAVRRAMTGKKIFIADGHHRYETALAYRDYRRAEAAGQSEAGRPAAWTGEEGFNFFPVFLSNMDENGLTILPTHRLILDAGNLTLDDVLERSSRYFKIKRFPFLPENEDEARAGFLRSLAEAGKDSPHEAGRPAFGFCWDSAPCYYLLTLKDMDAVSRLHGHNRSETYCNLDVTILHSLIVENALGIDTDKISSSQPVQFEKDSERAIDRVASGEFAMCFLLNPTKVGEVKKIALAREIMPQKSTYFYPKLLTGLVIADLNQI